MLITFLASYLIWLLLAGLVFLWVVDGRIKKEVALHAGLAYAVSWLVTFILKLVFHTQRPFMITQLPPLTATIPQDYSFPSGHAATAFGLAVTVFLHNKKIGAFFLVVATVIALARVWAHVHWPIDVIGGAVIGTTVAYLIEKRHTFKFLEKR
jgi:undecaprenyl-diphosphatase